MINTKTLARALSQGAVGYCPAEAARLPANDTAPSNPRTVISEAEQRNTAKLRAAAFEARKDERQMGLI